MQVIEGDTPTEPSRLARAPASRPSTRAAPPRLAPRRPPRLALDSRRDSAATRAATRAASSPPRSSDVLPAVSLNVSASQPSRTDFRNSSSTPSRALRATTRRFRAPTASSFLAHHVDERGRENGFFFRSFAVVVVVASLVHFPRTRGGSRSAGAHPADATYPTAARSAPSSSIPTRPSRSIVFAVSFGERRGQRGDVAPRVIALGSGGGGDVGGFARANLREPRDVYRGGSADSAPPRVVRQRRRRRRRQGLPTRSSRRQTRLRPRASRRRTRLRPRKASRLRPPRPAGRRSRSRIP